MKNFLKLSLAGLFLAHIIFLSSCAEPQSNKDSSGSAPANEAAKAGQSAVQDELSERNVVQIAVGSPDHKTLVKAVTHAGLVDALSNVGPFTVFAPVDAAFEALPAGTLESLMKPENKNQLISILEYHVFVGVIREDFIGDGMNLNQVNGKNAKLIKSDGKIMINDATVLGSVKASNGIVYVIDKVLVP